MGFEAVRTGLREQGQEGTAQCSVLAYIGFPLCPVCPLSPVPSSLLPSSAHFLTPSFSAPPCLSCHPSTGLPLSSLLPGLSPHPRKWSPWGHQVVSTPHCGLFCDPFLPPNTSTDPIHPAETSTQNAPLLSPPSVNSSPHGDHGGASLLPVSPAALSCSQASNGSSS